MTGWFYFIREEKNPKVLPCVFIFVTPLKFFNCSLSVLSLSFSLTWNLFTACHQSCLCLSVCLSVLPRQYTGLHNSAVKQQMPHSNVEITSFIPVLADWNLHMLQTLSRQKRPTNCTPNDSWLHFFFFLNTFGTLAQMCLAYSFELWGRPFCSSLLVSFFWCCYERNSIHTASLSHFIFLIHSAHQLFFIQPWTVAGFT